MTKEIVDDARVYIHYPSHGDATVVHIDVESPRIERIIHPGETTMARGKRKGLFIALKSEMIRRALAERGGPKLDDFRPLASVLKDNTSGSLDILRRVLAMGREGKLTPGDLDEIMARHGTMAAIFSFVSLAKEKGIEYAVETFSHILQEENSMVERMADYLQNRGRSVVTISRSSSVERVIIELHRRGAIDRVIVLESRPAREGVLMASAFASAGIETIVMTDASVYYATEMADYALVGCDGFTDDRYVNKTGTRSLVRAMFDNGESVFVATSEIKWIADWDLYERILIENDRHDPAELDLPPDVMGINRYFEVIPRKGEVYLHEVIG